LHKNHQPKAGESARAWVALTHQGEKILSLSEASCQMAVYSQPRKQSDTPVLQPTVQAINTEKYQGIPGADIVFPKTGLYQLELSCTPKTEDDFKAFQLKYDVTVATGVAVSTPKAKTSSQKTTASADIKESDRQQGNLLAIALTVLGLGIVGIVVWRVIKH
jgi:hypothetical protein